MDHKPITGDKLKKVTRLIRDKSKVQDAFAAFYYSKNGASHKANGDNDVKHAYARMTDKFKKSIGIDLINPVAERLRAKLNK